ncbi:C6 zinc finger domain-containing protein [Cercophora scortea]|uniref:C6 zinc finger domain-containing protein n=1 Tax=Cercophora scortea TaxID=314031 RepID=A0AAE0IG29_9PEZI|nr:C6 zinc finger domain-containing protein [Cercophora scortea]
MNPALRQNALPRSHSQPRIRYASPHLYPQPQNSKPQTQYQEPSPPYINTADGLGQIDSFEVSPPKRPRINSTGPAERASSRGRQNSHARRKSSPNGAGDELDGDESRPATGSSAATPAAAKSRRVRTGCLTCRERHLKCDEGMPDCNNCRKSSRECKRGVRLNFIDIQVKNPRIVPPTVDWSVHFQDESRLIASEYRGGLGRYPRDTGSTFTPPRETEPDAALPQHSPGNRDASLSLTKNGYYHPGVPGQIPSPEGQDDYGEFQLAQMRGLEPRKDSDPLLNIQAPHHGPTSLLESSGSFPLTTLHDQYAIREDTASRGHAYRVSNASVASSLIPQNTGAASSLVIHGAGPAQTTQNARQRTQGHSHERGTPERALTPPSETAGERDYLNDEEEIHFMQVFIDNIAIWMDSLNKEKHFTNLTPYLALKSPMLLNAFLACGVKHLTQVESYSDEKALFYYDTATTQLLRSLQNPNRNMAECATTAVVLNVYEIMSEKPTQRMNHIAGARALIRECGWNAATTGIGGACFWLNIGMEVLSCLAFNWQTAWDPDQWGLDQTIINSTAGSQDAGPSSDNGSREREKDTNKVAGAGDEELWAHQILFIMAKIANFRANIPRFQEASPHDEQVRLQSRFAEWKRLKSMCDTWNNNCPRSMSPYGYSHSSGRSLFPNVWLIKQPAIIGRLFYHTAMCLLAQINPLNPRDSDENRAAQLHHSHQVCGIVAHTKDRGVASVAIRSLAVAGAVLVNHEEQTEVLAILDKISRETGWRLGKVLTELKKAWRWESPAPPLLFSAPSLQQQQQEREREQHEHAISASRAAASTPTLPAAAASSASAPTRPTVNPLLVNADFRHRNHPYQNWYEPPNKTNLFNSQQGLWPS